MSELRSRGDERGVGTIALDGNPPVPIVERLWEGPPVEYVRSESAVLPDQNWSATDSHGHEHRWHRTERNWQRHEDALPTLVASEQHVPCDGTCGNWDCEGYSITVWHCAQCGDPVEPGFVPDFEARTMGIRIETGPARLTFTAGGNPLGSVIEGRSVTHTAVIRMDGNEYPADAWVGEYEMSSYDGFRVQIVVGELHHVDTAPAR